ncbi:MAG: alpha/beta hydrolase [Planctomycetota bacterium]|jgi:enterochelin esterase family protein
MNAREVTLYHPTALPAASDEAPTLCVFLDAEYYLNSLGAVDLIVGLVERGEIPPVVCVFVSHVDAAQRRLDYTCNTAYSRFVACDVVRWAHGQVPGLSEAGRTIVGMSLSGLAGAHAVYKHPEVFERWVFQSGSFWWNDEYLTGRLNRPMDNGKRCWVSVGDEETQADITHPPSNMRQVVSQSHACRRFADTVTGRGASVLFNLYAGGHDTKHWGAELPDALRWVFREG